MNGKYAKYIPSEYGFITKLEIEGDTLHVHTKMTDKNEPLKYPLKEKIGEYSQRLEKQYRLVSADKNAQLIKNDLISKTKEKLNTTLLVLSAPILLTAIISSILLAEIIPVIAGSGVIVTLLVSKKIALNKMSSNFEDEMDIVKTYLEARNDIEKLSEKDPNVINNLGKTTIGRINENEMLYEEQIIPEVFDITLLDDLINKKKFKELKKLLINYMICMALQQPQVFVNPTEESNNTHEKTKTKSNK